MGSSTIKLSQVVDTLTAKGIPDPRSGASGYGDNMAFDLATQVFADIACERFNWPWNRAKAAAFATNSWQQDYPQPAQAAGLIGWGESCEATDINNTSMPKPLYNPTWRRGLDRNNTSTWRFANLCWMYNKDLYLGAWPGPETVYSPLITTQPQPLNPIMNFMDVNGNILILTGFGTTFDGATLEIASIVATTTAATGKAYNIAVTFTEPLATTTGGLQVTFEGLTHVTALNGETLTSVFVKDGAENTLYFLQTLGAAYSGSETGTLAVPAAAPQLPAGSAEGVTAQDGTVVWTCVSPTSQGFRLGSLPPATGPCWLIEPSFQVDPPKFTSWSQTLDPMPDSFSRFFYRGMESELLIASPNPADVKRGQAAKEAWMESMVMAMKQGDRSPNVYSLIPATSVVEPRWGDNRGPYTADQPY